ncbi:TetR family transcriptional regulator [Streptomyces sp. PU-14G]|uniref:TetR/AcrR family transcriptional regulator n=1 Tax=Streptomyces sp. PU-14G TaxID=2800808 RepID=UPI0034DFB56B
MTAYRTARKRDAAATRQALVQAAAALFAERGYERTTVREIAARAGVNQALLFRYFGSKQSLFEEVVAGESLRHLRETPPENVLETALRGLLAAGTEEQGQRHRALEIFLRSAVGGTATRTGALLSEEYVDALATLTDAEDAALRADLVLAWLLGIGLTRSVVGKGALAGADPGEVCALVLDCARTMLEKLPEDGAR